MAFDIESIIEGIRESRRFFLKHVEGVREDQWDWKPYPECKSIRETLAHLVSDDRASIAMLRDGSITDYEAFEVQETDVPKLLDLLNQSHEAYCAFVRDRYADAPLDTEINFFLGKTKLGLAIAGISGEDQYHAGQVAFIRMATDPEWNYYEAIYDFSG